VDGTLTVTLGAMNTAGAVNTVTSSALQLNLSVGILDTGGNALTGYVLTTASAPQFCWAHRRRAPPGRRAAFLPGRTGRASRRPQKLKIPMPDMYQDQADLPPCQCVRHAQTVSDVAIGG
jgi:hypothetical protein